MDNSCQYEKVLLAYRCGVRKKNIVHPKQLFRTVLLIGLLCCSTFAFAQPPYQEGDPGSGPTVDETIDEWVEDEGTPA